MLVFSVYLLLRGHNEPATPLAAPSPSVFPPIGRIEAAIPTLNGCFSDFERHAVENMRLS